MDQDFADYDRWMRRAGSLAAAFALLAPLWLFLLLVLPRMGFGPIGGLLVSSLIAGGLAIWGERRWRRSRATAAPPGTGGGGRARRAPMPSGVRWAALALAGLVVLYLVLVARAGG